MVGRAVLIGIIHIYFARPVYNIVERNNSVSLLCIQYFMIFICTQMCVCVCVYYFTGAASDFTPNILFQYILLCLLACTVKKLEASISDLCFVRLHNSELSHSFI